MRTHHTDGMADGGRKGGFLDGLRGLRGKFVSSTATPTFKEEPRKSFSPKVVTLGLFMQQLAKYEIGVAKLVRDEAMVTIKVDVGLDVYENFVLRVDRWQLVKQFREVKSALTPAREWVWASTLQVRPWAVVD